MLGMFDDPTIRRLRLERNYLWVYPLIHETAPVEVVETEEAAVLVLLVSRTVYVRKPMVAGIRAKLKAKGRGNGEWFPTIEVQ